MTLYVIFDGFGKQVFCTYDKSLTSFKTLPREEFNVEKCSWGVCEEYDTTSDKICVKDLNTGVISVVEKPADYQEYPHKPAP